MTETRYTADHEWVRLEDGVAVVGITAHAASQLGDIVFVELPEKGRHLSAGDACAVVESVKAASDIFAPLAGQVEAANAAVAAAPALIGQDPTASGWLFRMVVEDLAEFHRLMDKSAYDAMVESA